MGAKSIMERCVAGLEDRDFSGSSRLAMDSLRPYQVRV